VDQKTLTVTGGAITTPQMQTVTIAEPVSQMTVSGGTITVRGTSKPTSTINISVNGKKENTTQTNTEGAFDSSVTLSNE
jgi:predicted nucleotidyltransferase